MKNTKEVKVKGHKLRRSQDKNDPKYKKTDGNIKESRDK